MRFTNTPSGAPPGLPQSCSIESLETSTQARPTTPTRLPWRRQMVLYVSGAAATAPPGGGVLPGGASGPGSEIARPPGSSPPSSLLPKYVER